MGYTNHYRHPTGTTEASSEAVINDINALVQQSGMRLKVQRGDGGITFNGIGRGGPEPFKWDRSAEPERYVFCKTYRRKYDAVVFAALLVIKYHHPDAAIKTDDCRSLEDTAYAIRAREYDFRSVAELMIKTKVNEFSRQHQRGLDLYRQTFPDREVEHLLPWQPVV